MAVNNNVPVENNAWVQAIIDRGKKSAAAERNTGELGKEEFLNLLVTQLRYQDPLNPVEDKEFIAQMAQFSALEQMQNMNASNNAMKGFQMIGKYVTAQTKNETTGVVTEVEGHVESVTMEGSKTILVVGGKEIPIEDVVNVTEGFNPLDSSLSAYTGLIGFDVDGAVYDTTTGEIVGVNGNVVSLAKGTYEDYAMLNGVTAQVIGKSVDGELEQDRNKLIEYFDSVLTKTNPAERVVEVFITNSEEQRVPISATLKNYEYDKSTGIVSAEFDGVAVPVASVAKIGSAAGDESIPAVEETDKKDGTDGTDGTDKTDATDGTDSTEKTDGSGETGNGNIPEA